MRSEQTDHDEEEIFDEALRVPAGPARDAFIAERCAGDSQLQERVHGLLHAFEESHDLETPLGGPFSTLNSIPTLIGTRVGRFNVLELLGEGGMGEVYLARDVDSPQNLVAIKVIKAGMESRQILARFELERRALRQLNHPHIAHWIDAGMAANGRPFVAMELVRGLPITEYCDREQLPVAERLRLLLDACSAVEHAHRHGIVHRDLKPSNIIVTRQDGRSVVKVIDFGVAKSCDSTRQVNTRYTLATHWIGTPCYISPEQARWSMDVDARTDVFSLGTVLYELCTGSIPLNPQRANGMDLETLRITICDEAPTAPSHYLARLDASQTVDVARVRSVGPAELQRTVRGDLDWIILKALEKKRDHRFATVGDFANDLRAVLEYRRPVAGPPHLSLRLKRWGARHRQTLYVAAFAALLVGSLIAGVVAWRIQQTIKQREQTLATEKQRIEEELSAANYAMDIRAAAKGLDSQVPAAARSLLEKWRRPESPFRDRFVLNYLRMLAAKPLAEWRPHQAPLLDMDLSSDGHWLASSDRAGDIVIWDLQQHREQYRLHPSNAEVTRVRFSPDGTRLATAGQDRSVRVWNVAHGIPCGELTGHAHTINGLAWSPDGNMIASGDRDGRVHLWDIPRLTLHRSLEKHVEPVLSLAWSPNGRYLATSEGSRGVHVWNTEDWSECGFHESVEGKILAVTFSPDSRLIAYGGYGHLVGIAHVGQIKPTQHPPVACGLWTIAFLSPDELLVGNGDGAIEVIQYSALTNEWYSARRYTASMSRVRALAIGNNGTILQATEQDQAIRIIPSTVLTDREAIGSPRRFPVRPLTVSNLVLLSDANGTNQEFRQATDNRLIFGVKQNIDVSVSPVYCESRRLIAVALESSNASQTIALLSQPDGRELARLQFPGECHDVSISRDAKFLSVAGKDPDKGPIVLVYDLQSLSSRQLDAMPGGLWDRAAFSPFCDVLVAGSVCSKQLQCFDARTLQTIRTVETTSAWMTFEFLPQSDGLVVGHQDAVSVWDSDLENMRWQMHVGNSDDDAKGIAITPDESTIVVLRIRNMQFFDCSTHSLLFERPTTLRGNRDVSFFDSHTLRTVSRHGATRHVEAECEEFQDTQLFQGWSLFDRRRSRQKHCSDVRASPTDFQIPDRHSVESAGDRAARKFLRLSET